MAADYIGKSETMEKQALIPHNIKPCPAWVICVYATLAVLLQAFCTVDRIMWAMYVFPLPQLLFLFHGAGVFLLLWDTLTERIWMRKKQIRPLVGTLLAIFLSSCLWWEYSIENMKVLAVQAVQMLLFFPLTWRLSRRNCLRLLRGIYTGISVGYIPAILISICRFFLHEVGVTEGRLLGVFALFYPPAVVSGIMAVASVYFAWKAERPWERCIFAGAGVVYGAFNILNGTRAVLVAYAAAILLTTVLLFWNWHNQEGRSKDRYLRIGGCLLLSAVLLGMVVCAGILMRTDVKPENITNNRIYIWKDYLEVTCAEPKTVFFGFSPRGYQPEIRERYPDIFIVSYIREHYPNTFQGGNIYDIHNGYLSVFVCTGILGTCFVGAFFLLWFRQLLGWIRSQKKLSCEALALLAELTLLLSAVFFDSDLFFYYNSTTLLFWILAGCSFRIMEPEDGCGRICNERAPLRTGNRP